VEPVRTGDTIHAVGATPDMWPQAAVAGPDHVNTSCTAPGGEAQAGRDVVAKPTIRDILEPIGRVPEDKVKSTVGSNGAEMGKPFIRVTDGVPTPFGKGVRRRSRVERAQPAPGQKGLVSMVRMVPIPTGVQV
ncbi:hypothetical protein RUND412_011249, partial [Rhizina undulata]